MNLAGRLRALIGQSGPLPLSRFMADAVAEYYATREPFGAKGDFTTAPEISQMFGEMLGLWAVDTWTRLGRPRPCALVELGPGRGTLMADLLRAGRVEPGFHEAVAVHLVETSAGLRARQRAALAGCGKTLTFADRLGEVPDMPFLLLANEFFDALPIRQFQKVGAEWRERLVGLDAAGQFAFQLAPGPPELAGLLALEQRDAPPGSVVEIGLPARAIGAEIAERALRHPGAALVIDYGAPVAGLGDTLQALRRHAHVPPLHDPGEADLTAHVDFAAIAAAARGAGARVFGPLAQGEFLGRLGIRLRAARLKAAASPPQATEIDQALERLTAPAAMGSLFQCLCIASPALDEIAPFDPADP
ncbi:MAG: SAM-dependent methyltransferase [Alphaproteobacteria bacterium]|nr:SAM-dependent methyltransferase [Alphaproteobacteria bacterium]